MTIPDYQGLMLPLLKCAKGGEEIRTTDCVGKIASELSLSESEIEELLPSGKQTVLSNRIHWARTYLSKAGLLVPTQRGHFKITVRGLEVLSRNFTYVDNTTLSEFPEFVAWRTNGSNALDKTGSTNSSSIDIAIKLSPEEQIEQAYEALKTQLKSEILENLVSVSPSMFERIIIDLLIAMGYGGGRAEMGKALGKTNDGGVDGVIKEDELGLDVVYIQAKKYADTTISRPDIQSFVGSLEGFNATKGIFVTTSSFASTVKDYVQRIHKRIVLIDGAQLSELMIRHGVGVRKKDVYELKRLDEDYFAE